MMISGFKVLSIAQLFCNLSKTNFARSIGLSMVDFTTTMFLGLGIVSI